MARGARFIRGYPKQVRPLIRRFKRGAVNRELIRQIRPRIHARPWKLRATPNRDMWLESHAVQGIRGSLQERIVFQALIDHGLIEGADFTFQSSQLGGRAQLGGLVADFLFEAPKVILQVQSSWHTLTLAHEVRDTDQMMILRDMGYTVLEIWPNTIEDPAALDWWVERNIMHLWGTSKQDIGEGYSVKHKYAELVFDNPWRIFNLFQIWLKIYLKVMGVPWQT